MLCTLLTERRVHWCVQVGSARRGRRLLHNGLLLNLRCGARALRLVRSAPDSRRLLGVDTGLRGRDLGARSDEVSTGVRRQARPHEGLVAPTLPSRGERRQRKLTMEVGILYRTDVRAYATLFSLPCT